MKKLLLGLLLAVTACQAQATDPQADLRILNSVGEQAGYWPCMRQALTDNGNAALIRNNPIDTSDELTDSIATAQVGCEPEFTRFVDGLKKAYREPNFGSPEELEELRYMIYQTLYKQLAGG